MKGFLYIDKIKVGFINLKILDESMGGIGGELIVNENYKVYKKQIQNQYEKCGIANINDFNFKIVLENNLELYPEGGIGVIDSKEFNELFVEVSGVDSETIEKIKNNR